MLDKQLVKQGSTVIGGNNIIIKKALTPSLEKEGGWVSGPYEEEGFGGFHHPFDPSGPFHPFNQFYSHGYNFNFNYY